MAELQTRRNTRTETEDRSHATGWSFPAQDGAEQGQGLSAARQAASLLRLSLEEFVWATRCVVCDRPGSLLCTRCRTLLPYVDRWLACPRCGAPYGRSLCTECNSFSLRDQGLNALPYDACASAIMHAGPARSLVTAYKDAGERRLAAIIAELVLWSLPPRFLDEAEIVTYIPADKKARRRRGFDHMHSVAQCFAELSGLRLETVLTKHGGIDQRGLSRSERIRNMRNVIEVSPEWIGRTPNSLVLLDDVQTTGATLCAGAQALKEHGANHVFCATLARTL